MTPDRRAALTCRATALALAALACALAAHQQWAYAGVCAYLAFIALLIAAGLTWHTTKRQPAAVCCQYGRHSGGAAHTADCTRSAT
ncbi:hypothetical protein ABZT03_43155 [Streptomyces sp. NPDC005574]|uniref:hypothetical protein n=1 Tax=Streptomyces sp. NPDC005574 TaxID=3156891 RepID=UPI0033B3AFF2